jgi:CubicO group peptidase (beta-lactamase class C family)
VARGGRTILDKAYGAERGLPVQTDTRFWIASGGKQFTSAAILKCKEEGLLELDDSIVKFFPGAPADKRAITIRQLLAHLSGLGQSYVSEGAGDRQTAVDRILGEALVDAPGRGFHYSNNNYQLAVAVVEIATGLPYREFVHEKLWRLAGLKDTGFSGETGARLVAPARRETPARLSGVTWGGEGVFSTTHDLLRWYRALRAGRVLSSASVDEIFSPAASIQEGQAALGWFIGRTSHNRARIFTRGNEDFGANGLIYAYPDPDTVIIVLTHAGNANDNVSWSRFVHEKLEKLLSL